MLQLVELTVGEGSHEAFSFFWPGDRSVNLERMEATTFDNGLACEIQKLFTVSFGCKAKKDDLERLKILGQEDELL